MDDLIGIEFCDFCSGGSIRRTEAIIEDEVYAPLIKDRGTFEDRDFDGDCMFSIEFIENLIQIRKSLGCSIKTGLSV